MSELEQYVNYFRAVDVPPSKTHICRVTDRGVYLPSNPVHLLLGFIYLLKEGIISQDDSLLDAGSGDGRVAILGSLLGMRSTGVEYDSKLVELARYHAQQLGTDTTFLQGDFTDNATYHPGSFRDFSLVYNFINNEDKVAEKIAQDSREGTKFLLYGCVDNEQFPGLDCTGGFNLHDDLVPTNPIAPRIGAIHIYHKPLGQRVWATTSRL